MPVNLESPFWVRKSPRLQTYEHLGETVVVAESVTETVKGKQYVTQPLPRQEQGFVRMDSTGIARFIEPIEWEI